MTTLRFKKIQLKKFKAFTNFSLSLSEMNMLVGPNNCGKSTVLGACRALAGAIRKANSRKAESIPGAGPYGEGWRIDAHLLPISVENVHHDYADEETEVAFQFSNNTSLTLRFPADGGCVLWADAGRRIVNPAAFRKYFPISVHHVPVLGPVENEEGLVNKETVLRDLGTHRASRHFRNYWHYFPDGFEKFAGMIRDTWPGMDVERPKQLNLLEKRLSMFCSEERINRELFWAGFGFQVWCQLLTHIALAQDATLLVLDEPETYLHPDLQRRLLLLLRETGPDVIFATHSTELMSEADPSDIVVVNKADNWGRRLRDLEGVQQALETIGSIQNITLTELSRHRRVVFVEGTKDFGIIRKFAKRHGMDRLAAPTDLSAVEVEAFGNWKKVQGAAWAIEKALGSKLAMAVVLDRDYRCDEEIAAIEAELRVHVPAVHILRSKEIENYLLVPAALRRAIERASKDRAERSGDDAVEVPDIEDLLREITEGFRSKAQSQYIAKRTEYLKGRRDAATITEETLDEFEQTWAVLGDRLRIVPGKKVLAALRSRVQKDTGLSFSDGAVITAMRLDETPTDMRQLLTTLEQFRTQPPP